MRNPVELGRSVVIRSGDPVPDPWRECRVFEITSALLADPDHLEEVVTSMHAAWVAREPYVVESSIDDLTLASPEQSDESPWELGPGFTFLRERLHHLVWVNSWDHRRDPPVWWWGRKAERLGAQVGGEHDVVLVDGTEARVDGGPRGSVPLGVPVVHFESVLDGSLQLEQRGPAVESGLAPDQDEAVRHGAGAARVIAPAGSGKTRTLVARLRYLVETNGYPIDCVTAVAYNTRAAREMSTRLGPGSSGAVRTLHSLGRAILLDAQGDLELLGEREVRRLLEPLVQAPRRPNTDIIGPYIEALSEVRIGLRDPAEVEGGRDDVPGFTELFELYRTRLSNRRAHDFDEQIYGALLTLLTDPELRRRWQRRCRHMLVDEFQDLTPGYLLLVRLLASPQLDVFGVGDDDQVIYGYAGADPRYLIDFDRLFPGAGHHALEVNYRCPGPVVKAAKDLLAHNRTRIDKTIEAAKHLDSGLRVERTESSQAVSRVVECIESWTASGVDPADIVVLCRVNSALLPVHAGLVEAGIPMRSPITPSVLDRTLLSAVLAWMRIGLDPDQISRFDLMAAVRRPSRGLNRIAADLVGRRRTVSWSSLYELRRSLDGRRRTRWEEFCNDIQTVSRAAAGDDVPAMISKLNHDIGLDRAADALDAGRTRADRSGQSDDLRAMERVASIHAALSDFEPWLRAVTAAPDDPLGVTLTTVHRVKGLEWRKVIVYGADVGLMPHDLAFDREEERRVFHVALTRAIDEAVIIADAARVSPFVAEAEGNAPVVEEPPASPIRRRSAPGAGVRVAAGDRVSLSGGFSGVVERELPIGILVALEPGPGRMSVKWGEQVSTADGSGRLEPGAVAADAGLMAALKRWRLDTARRQNVPAFVVLTDASLEEVARRRPQTESELLGVHGIGPAKLEAYGDDLLAIVADE